MAIDRSTPFSMVNSDSAPHQHRYLRPSSYGSYRQPGVNPGRITTFLRTRFWPIFFGFVLVMGAITAVTFLLPKTYESSASFLVEQQQRTGAEMPALDVLGRMGRVATRETEIALLQSRRVLEPVVERGDLHVTVDTGDGALRPTDVFTSFQAGTNAVEGSYEIRVALDGQTEVFNTDSAASIATAQPGLPLAFANVRAGPLHVAPVGAPIQGSSAAEAIVVEIVPFSQAVHETQERIEVAAVQRDADLVALTCSSRTPAGAKWLCDAVTSSYLALRSDLQTAEAAATADFLRDQVGLVQERLNAAEDSLRRFAERSQAVALETRAAEEVRQNAQLWAEREQLMAERASLEALTEQIETDPVSGTRKYRDFASFPTFLKNQNQIVTELVGNLLELDNRKNDLAVRRTEEDVELAALNSRTADIENQLRTIVVGYTRALSAQIRSLDEALNNSRAVLSAIPSQQIETARLERRLSLLEDLYGFLQTRLQEAEIAQAVELPSVRVVDRASLPFKHSSPNEPLNLALGFVLATSFGLLLGLWSEYNDPRLRERGAVEDVTDITVLGVLPGMKKPGPVISMRLASSARNGSKRQRGAESSNLIRHLTGTSKKKESRALTPPWTSERALALEAFRSIASDLAHAGRTLEEEGLRTVAVTSSSRGEGKTFTAANLAIARASHGSRVLLIDADLKGRGVSRFLRVAENSLGLTELLTPGAKAPQQFHIFKIGSGKTIHVLPAGAGSSHSAQLLEGKAFREFLARMRQRYELVVVDTPPLNVVTDAAAVASSVDGVVLVVRGGVTNRNALELALERLQRIGARTAGIVLNDVALTSSYGTYSHAE